MIMEQGNIPSLDGEEWRYITGYEGRYMVSNMGRILSSKFVNNRCVKDRYLIIKGSTDKDGYKLVALSLNGKSKTYKVHRLVLQSFRGNILGKNEVNHINGIKNDNRLFNLEWCTHQENINDYISKGRQVKTSKPIVQFDLSMNEIRKWESATEVERTLGYDQGNIVKYLKGKANHSYGYKWAYDNNVSIFLPK